jgi:hypothetical protein
MTTAHSSCRWRSRSGRLLLRGDLLEGQRDGFCHVIYGRSSGIANCGSDDAELPTRPDTERDEIFGTLIREPGLHMTRWWREMDSNFQFRDK